MARRSQSSSQGDNPLDPNYLPPHYKEYYRIAIDALAEDGLEGYERFLKEEGAPEFLCPSEIEHITRCLHRPPEVSQETSYTDTGYRTQDDADGSSGTYWPMHSDTAAPELDLGWPTNYGFQGTEVTTLIHPAPPDNPTIKEEIRRMIRSAQQVIGVVMDIFTDVDILSELIDAASRHIPVYIILDEMHSQLFLDMAAKCRVNLNYMEYFRVRTVSGPTYYCGKGSTFKGNLLQKFLLVDCNLVLSGTYSFMWSFEKIHRSIVHIFQGELVSSFDEEFRILFAQSDPLIPSETALARMEKPYMGMVPFSGPRPFFERKLHFLHPREDNSQSPFSSFGVDLDRHYLHQFRRDDAIRQSMENTGMRVYGKNMDPMEKMQMSYMHNKQLELEGFKRHSFAEGTFENYSSSRQYSRQILTNNNDEYRFQSSHFQKSQHMQTDRPFGPTRNQGLFDKIRAGRQIFPDMDEHESRYQNKGLPGESNLALEGPHMRIGYNPSNSSREVRYGSDQVMTGGEGRFGQRSQGRQTFQCQISPTQKQGMEQRNFFQDQDADKKPQDNRQGLRSWRISSYLSGIQPGQDEEGLPIPIDSDTCDDALVPVEKSVPASETLLKFSSDPVPPYKPYVATNESPMNLDRFPTNETLMKYSVDPVPPYKPSASITDTIIPLDRMGPANETLLKYSIDPIPPFKPFGSTGDLSTEKAKEKEEGLLTRHDSLRTRPSPLIQRGSRLRSSLIFSSSKLEQHMSSADLAQSETISENEDGKVSSKVAEILQKYRGVTKGANSSSVTQANAATKTIHEESEDGHNITQEAVAYKAVESTVHEKGSASHQQELQYKSLVSSQSRDGNSETISTTVTQTRAAARTIHKESVDGRNISTESVACKSAESNDVEKGSTVRHSQESHYKSVMDTDSSTISQSMSGTKTVHEESGDGCSTSMEAVAYRATESTVLDQGSAIHRQKESQYKSVATSRFQDLLTKDQETVSVTKTRQVTSSIHTIGGITSTLPEKMESGPVMTEITEVPKSTATEAHNSLGRHNSGLFFGTALESLSQVPTPLSSINKSEEDLSKTDQNPIEFIRKGSIRLKQFLQSKAEKKAEEDLSCDALKIEKQTKRSSKTDNVDSVTEGEEKSTKQLSASPPKSQATPQSRLSTSTSNVLFSSNLRDDTKVILEQISANSQKNRAEMVKQAQQAQPTSDSDTTGSNAVSEVDKVEESNNSDTSALNRTGSFLSRSRFSRPSPTTPDDRDVLLKRMESIRKEKRVYSRFEVFCKKDEPSHGEEYEDVEAKDKKVGKFIPKILGSLIKK